MPAREERLAEALDHPLLREVIGSIEDSGTAEDTRRWGLLMSWFDVRDQALAEIGPRIEPPTAPAQPQPERTDEYERGFLAGIEAVRVALELAREYGLKVVGKALREMATSRGEGTPSTDGGDHG